MKNSLETRLGLFFAISLIVVFLLVEMVGNKSAFSKGVPMSAEFENIQELKPGDPVKMAGVEVGSIRDIRLAEGKVRVDLTVNPDIEIRTSSKASIKFVGLLGQNYISLSFGNPTDPKAVANAMLQTEEQPDIASLMAKLEGVASGVENLTRSFDSDGFTKMLAPVTDFIESNSENFSALIENARNVTTEVAEGRGSIGKLIMDDSFYNSTMASVESLQGAVTNVNETFGGAKAIIDRINAGEGSLGLLSSDDAIYKEGRDALANLREVLQKINQGKGSIGLLVNDKAFYDSAKLTLQKVDKATESLEDQGPLSILGLAVNSLF